MAVVTSVLAQICLLGNHTKNKRVLLVSGDLAPDLSINRSADAWDFFFFFSVFNWNFQFCAIPSKNLKVKFLMLQSFAKPPKNVKSFRKNL